MMTPTVLVRRDPAALTELEPEWRALWDADASASLFHTPEYARAAWETELGADRSLAAVEVRLADRLIGLTTVTVDPDGVLRFLGNSEVTDYLGPLAAEADRPTVARAVVDAVTGIDGWTRAELLGLAVDTGWAELLGDAARAAGLAVTETQQDVCPRIALAGSFEDYLTALPSKLRHEIRRKARRLERELGPFDVRLTTTETRETDLERFYELHRSSSGPKGKFMHDGMVALFDRLAAVFDARGWLRLAWLEAAGEMVAATLSFSERGVWSVYNATYDQRYREVGPGMVLMGETVRLAIEDGCTTFDLLRGDEPYKYRFGAVDVALVGLTIGRT